MTNLKINSVFDILIEVWHMQMEKTNQDLITYGK